MTVPLLCLLFSTSPLKSLWYSWYTVCYLSFHNYLFYVLFLPVILSSILHTSFSPLHSSHYYFFSLPHLPFLNHSSFTLSLQLTFSFPSYPSPSLPSQLLPCFLSLAPPILSPLLPVLQTLTFWPVPSAQPQHYLIAVLPPPQNLGLRIPPRRAHQRNIFPVTHRHVTRCLLVNYVRGHCRDRREGWLVLCSL